MFRLLAICILLTSTLYASDECTDFSKKIDSSNSKLYSRCSKACDKDEDCSSVKHGCESYAVNKLYEETYPAFMDQFQNRNCLVDSINSNCGIAKCQKNYCSLDLKRCDQSAMAPAAYSPRISVPQAERMNSYRLLTLFGDPKAFGKNCPDNQNYLDELYSKTEHNFNSVEKLLDQINIDTKVDDICKIYLLLNIDARNTFKITNEVEYEKLATKADAQLATKIMNIIQNNSSKDVSRLLNAMDIRTWSVNPNNKSFLKLDHNSVKSKESKDILFSIKLSLARIGHLTLNNEDYEYYLFDFLPEHVETPILPLDLDFLGNKELKAYMAQNKENLYTPLMDGKLNYLAKRPMYLNLLVNEKSLKNLKSIIENDKIAPSLKCMAFNLNEEGFSKIEDKKIIKEIAEADFSKTPCLNGLHTMAKNIKFTKVDKCEIGYYSMIPVVGKPAIRVNNENIIPVINNACLGACKVDSDCINLEKTSCRIVPGNLKYAEKYRTSLPELMACNLSENYQYKFSCVDNQCTLNQNCSQNDYKKDADLFNDLSKDSTCELDYQCKKLDFISFPSLNEVHIGYKPSLSNPTQLRSFGTYLSKKCGTSRKYSPMDQGSCINKSCRNIEFIEGNSGMPRTPPNP